MTTEAASLLELRERSGTAGNAFAGPNPLLRFRRFIETSDWDVMPPARQRWIDGACAAVLAASLIYFLPVLARIFLR